MGLLVFLIDLGSEREEGAELEGISYNKHVDARPNTLRHVPIHTAHPSCQSNPGLAQISHMKILESLHGCVFFTVWKESYRQDFYP